jgi:hypothetical protein
VALRPSDSAVRTSPTSCIMAFRTGAGRVKNPRTISAGQLTTSAHALAGADRIHLITTGGVKHSIRKECALTKADGSINNPIGRSLQRHSQLLCEGGGCAATAWLRSHPVPRARRRLALSQWGKKHVEVRLQSRTTTSSRIDNTAAQYDSEVGRR